MGRSRMSWRDYTSYLPGNTSGTPWKKLESVAGEQDMWNILLSLLPCDPTLDNQKISALRTLAYKTLHCFTF